jgi:ABC-type antimicrobial peptide transport system permease subunit
MNARRLVIRSLIHHWRINVAVALGVAAATAVLTGALLIGDSMRGSLRGLTLDRLGAIDEILIVDRFFRVELASELAASPGFRENYKQAVPAIMFPQGTVETSTDDPQQDRSRAGNVLVLGIESEFWDLDKSDTARPAALAANEIILNEPLATELGVGVGDRVTLRLPKLQDINPDSPLGKKDDPVRSLPRLKVAQVIPAKGLGRFDLRASQSLSRNAYIALPTLQEALRQEGLANALLVAGTNPNQPPDAAASKQLAAALDPRLEDYGLLITPVDLSWEPPENARNIIPNITLSYFSLSSTRMVLSDEVDEVARHAFKDHQSQPVLIYLANAIYKPSDQQHATSTSGLVDKTQPQVAEDQLVPYSLIAAVDPAATLGPLIGSSGSPLPPPADDEIIITSWLADDLQVAAGDWLRIEFYQPETTHGKNVESFIDLRVASIADLVKPDQPYRLRRPARYLQPRSLINDPDLTPRVPGVTDKRSINDWDLPFPLVHSIRPQDDEFWNNYRTTPKAFISLQVGHKLWGSRFGQTTSIRIVPEGHDSQQAAADQPWNVERLGSAFVDSARQLQEPLGFEFLPVKREGLEASSGATPFDLLFLALSLFVIAAALMLVGLLFRLGLQQRSQQTGLLTALGIPRKKIAWMLIAENSLVSVLGSLLGLAAGIGYAILMVAGLRSWWVGAIVTPFLEFHWSGQTMLLGGLLGTVISILTIGISIWRSRTIAARQLLAGQLEGGLGSARYKSPRWLSITTFSLFICGLALAGLAAQPSFVAILGSEGQAGAFVGGGAAILAGLLLVIRARIRNSGEGNRSLADPPVLLRMAMRNAGRNPQRSTMTIGLVASASFLILSMGAFRLDVTRNGTGGFDSLATSSVAIYENLAESKGKLLQLGQENTDRLEGATIMPLRLKPGDDASCNNMYRARRPQVLGVSPLLVAHFDIAGPDHFAWASSAAEDQQSIANPWRLLDNEQPHLGSKDDPVPVVIDKNTAMFALQLMGGIGQVFPITYENDQTIHFRVAGLLANSVLQGTLLIGEVDFQQLFPTISGYRYFLIDSGTVARQTVQQVLENQLGDHGFDIQSADQKLASLLAVQNTYLSTFQSLGALGLLLGTFGLATIQVRNIIERRAELALLRSTGFPRRRIANMIMLENLLLLLGGLMTGGLGAACAVLPHVALAGASAPGMDLAIMISVILLVGIITSLVAIRVTLRAPLLPALRGD